MTDQELKDLVASLDIGNKELREAQLKTDEQMRQVQMQMQQSQAKTDDQIKRVSKDLGNIGNSIPLHTNLKTLHMFSTCNKVA